MCQHPQRRGAPLQSSSSIVDFTLQIGLDARRQTEPRDMLVVPMHGEVVIETEGICTRLDGEIIWAIIHVDAITVP